MAIRHDPLCHALFGARPCSCGAKPELADDGGDLARFAEIALTELAGDPEWGRELDRLSALEARPDSSGLET